MQNTMVGGGGMIKYTIYTPVIIKVRIKIDITEHVSLFLGGPEKHGRSWEEAYLYGECEY